LLFVLAKVNLSWYTWSGSSDKLSYSTIQLYKTYFAKPFWKRFRKSFTRKLGTTVSNLTKSSFYLTYTQLLTQFDIKSALVTLPSTNSPDLAYLYPNTLIPFSFQTKTYNTLMFFMITLLVNFYPPTQSEFQLYYAFIWRSPNLLQYNFLNHFYFRLKNY
jgi:hypothetical protein